MNTKNYQWLEMINSIEEMLKEYDNVKITENVNRYREGENGTNYFIEEKFTHWSLNNYISLSVYPFENGKKCVLRTNQITTGDNSISSELIVVKDGDKITFSRKDGFSNSRNDKPLTPFSISCIVVNILLKIDNFNKLFQMLGGNSEKIDKVKAYIFSQEINILDHDVNNNLESLVENGLELEKIDNDKLVKIMIKKWFTGENEKLFNVLEPSLYNSKDYFLALCNDNGLFDNEYIQYRRNFYKVNSADIWLKRSH